MCSHAARPPRPETMHASHRQTLLRRCISLSLRPPGASVAYSRSSGLPVNISCRLPGLPTWVHSDVSAMPVKPPNDINEEVIPRDACPGSFGGLGRAPPAGEVLDIVYFLVRPVPVERVNLTCQSHHQSIDVDQQRSKKGNV